jgi:hypothetical protein
MIGASFVLWLAFMPMVGIAVVPVVLDLIAEPLFRFASWLRDLQRRIS